MTDKRRVEIYSAGCPVCDEAVSRVHQLACDSCEVTVLDMNQPDIFRNAGEMGIRSVPAVVIDDQLAGCCTAGIDEATLKKAGLGQAITN